MQDLDYERELSLLCQYLGKSRDEVLKTIDERHKQVTALWKTVKTPEETRKFYMESDFYLYDLFPWHFSKFQKELDQKVVQKVKAIPSAQTIMDYGCGTGYLSSLLALAGLKVTAVDVPSQTLDFFKFRARHLNLDVEFVDLIDFRDQLGCRRWDAIVSIDVLEHFPSWEAVEEILGFLNSRSDNLMANICWGKVFGIHPMHLDEPAPEVKKRLQAMYVEAYI